MRSGAEHQFFHWDQGTYDSFTSYLMSAQWRVVEQSGLKASAPMHVLVADARCEAVCLVFHGSRSAPPRTSTPACWCGGALNDRGAPPPAHPRAHACLSALSPRFTLGATQKWGECRRRQLRPPV